MKLIYVYLLLFLILIIIYFYINNNKNIENFNNSKYFHELPGHPHLDKKYGVLNCSPQEINDTLTYLLKSFMTHCNKHDIKPILMYGGLIGSYFNGKLLPWDDDIDLMLTEPSISKLKDYEGKDFVIDVNPNCTNYSIKDTKNKISARVISKKNGVFIDILYHKKVGNNLICKDKNNYEISDIYPLKQGIINNIPIYIPNNIKKVLKQRYGKVHVRKSAGIPNNINDWVLIKDKYWLR